MAAAAVGLLTLTAGGMGRDVGAYQGDPVGGAGCEGAEGEGWAGVEGANEAPDAPLDSAGPKTSTSAECGARMCEFSSPALLFEEGHACCKRPAKSDFGGGHDRRCPSNAPRPVSALISGPAFAEQVAFFTAAGEVRDLEGVWANPEVCRMEMLYTAGDLEAHTNTTGTRGAADEGRLDTEQVTYLCMVFAPAQRTGFASASAGDGRFLVHGGLVGEGQILGDLWELRGDTGTWTLLHSSQGLRAACCSGKPKWRVQNTGDVGRAILREGDSVDRFIVDVASGEISVPPPRAGHTATVVTARDGVQHLVIVGGFDPARGNLDDVWSYNFSSGEWGEQAPLRDHGHQLGRSGHAAFAEGDSVLVHGGNLMDDVWRFNLTENRWYSVQSAI